jgi:hypothetical protein
MILGKEWNSVNSISKRDTNSFYKQYKFSGNISGNIILEEQNSGAIFLRGSSLRAEAGVAPLDTPVTDRSHPRTNRVCSCFGCALSATLLQNRHRKGTDWTWPKKRK